MSKLWGRLIRWLAQEHITYLEYENRQLRYEGDRWRHKYEGAIDAMRVFERRYNWMEKTISEAAMLDLKPPVIISRKED